MISTSRYRLAKLSAIWLVGAALVFLLPWRVPQHNVLNSDSYVLGFSNQVGILGLWTTLLALVLCLGFFQKSGENPINGRFARLLHPSRVTRAELLFLLAFAGLYCLALWFLFKAIPTNQYGEMYYAVCRLELMLLGKAPYQDFEWTYGPFFLYLPLLLVKLSYYRLGTDVACQLSLMLSTVIGFGGVYYVLSQFRLWPRQRILIFLLVSSTLNIGLGFNTTHLRFICAFATLFFIHNQAAKVGGQRRRRLLLLLQIIVAIAVCFCISPEMGLVFCLGLFSYCAVQIKRGQRWYLGVIAVSLGLVIVTAFSSSFFRSTIAFASGGSNFPILPSAQILFFLFTICFIVPPLLGFGWRAHANSAPVAVGIGVMMTLYAVAALGRCDVTHLFNNGLALHLFALAFWTRYRPKFNAYVALFFLFFTVSYPLGYYFAYSTVLSKALQEHAEGVQKADRRFMSAAPDLTDPSLRELRARLLPLRHVGMPLNAEDDVELLLKRSGLYCFEFFPMPGLEVRTPKQLERKLRDVKAMPYIIVDREALHPAPFSAAGYTEEHGQYVSQAMLYLVDYKIKNTPFIPKDEVARYIRANFREIGSYKSYLIMKNKGAS